MILGVAAWFLLADGPWSAPWLSAGEREQIIGDLQRDEIQRIDSGRQSFHVARDCVVYFLWSSGNYGLTFWLPRILSTLGASNLSTGWWAYGHLRLRRTRDVVGQPSSRIPHIALAFS